MLGREVPSEIRTLAFHNDAMIPAELKYLRKGYSRRHPVDFSSLPELSSSDSQLVPSTASNEPRESSQMTHRYDSRSCHRETSDNRAWLDIILVIKMHRLDFHGLGEAFVAVEIDAGSLLSRYGV